MKPFTGFKTKCPAAGQRRLEHLRRVIKLIATKEYLVTKAEIRRKVLGISLTNSETWQARHG
jgi:hypothetical protein